ncbi:MAG: hypothetical protein M1822_007298 [Bathelium mastoideum]|nr:MAG: hypothetical protein M1822_007298 [Bathelium mastoideum]
MATANQRTPAATFDVIPGSLPQATVPMDADIEEAADIAINLLNEWASDHLADQIVWRDFLALTGTYRTFFSIATVFSIFQQLGLAKSRSSVRLTDRKPRVSVSLEDSAWVDIDFDFTTQEGQLVGCCSGTVSILQDQQGTWRIWMLRTWLECFDGHGNPDIPKPAEQLYTGATDREAATVNGNTNGATLPYDAIIVGGGQSGLALAGRLQAVGIRYLLLEKNVEIGDVWKDRYESLRWHTVKEYGELPFGRTFAVADPTFIPTKRIAEAHKAWSVKYGLNIITNSPVESASWDDTKKSWTVNVSVPAGKIAYMCRNLVLSIGGGTSSPVVPVWAQPQRIAASNFQGTIMHSKVYHSSTPWAGKRGIVVGTANTGHDVAEDMVQAAMETRMIQRNRTFVLPAEWLHAAQVVDYNQTKHTDRGDREVFTYPMKVSREMTNRAIHRSIKDHPEHFDALETAGFMVDRFGDIFDNLYVRIGGHYIDTGASQKIANGEIRMETKEVRGLTPDGLLLEDGSELQADLIVLCTGFDHDFRLQAKSIIGEIADQVDDYWGVDGEGEVRAYAKIAGHPRLYYHGGDVRMARWFSRFIALRIQAETLGSPLGIYAD